MPSPQAAVELLSAAYAASEDNVTSCELMGRQGIDLVLQHIAGTVDPLSDRHDWYVLMEWSSTRPRRDGDNAGSLREKMETYLGEAMEKGLVLDAVIAQTAAQSDVMEVVARVPVFPVRGFTEQSGIAEGLKLGIAEAELRQRVLRT